jgi:hypothetical protein
MNHRHTITANPLNPHLIDYPADDQSPLEAGRYHPPCSPLAFPLPPSTFRTCPALRIAELFDTTVEDAF